MGRELNIPELRQEAESGSVAAQGILGICYLNGIEVEINYQEAFRFLSAAAKRGAPRPVVNLARMYAQGLGIPKDVPEAVRHYEKAASAGEFPSLAELVELGRIYSRGVDVPADPDAALRWYSEAAACEGNVPDCQELHEAKAYLARTTRGHAL